MHNRFDHNSNIADLITAYEELNENLSTENQLHLEMEKLHIILCVESKLKRKLLQPEMLDRIEVTQQQTFFEKVLYYILMSLGILHSAIKSYMFGSGLVALIPALSSPIRVLLSLFYVCLQTILFYGFDISLLKNRFGFSGSNTNLYRFIDTLIEQVSTINTINRLLSTVLVFTLDDESKADYGRIVRLFNQDFQRKYQTLQANDRSVYRKIAIIGMVGFGIISTIAGSYFMTNSLLTFYAANLIGTPWGWAIIALFVSIELGFYYAMGATGIINLINKDYKNVNKLHREFSIFQNEQNTSHLIQIKHLTERFGPKEQREVATQTEQEPSSFSMRFI